MMKLMIHTCGASKEWYPQLYDSEGNVIARPYPGLLVISVNVLAETDFGFVIGLEELKGQFSLATVVWSIP